MTNIERDILGNITNTEPKAITYPEFIVQLAQKGATAEEIKMVRDLKRKYKIAVYTLEDCILNNAYLFHRKDLWKLMQSAGVTTWEDLVKIDSIDDIRKTIPGMNSSQYVILVVLYTKERYIRNMPIDPYWFDVIRRPKEA